MIYEQKTRNQCGYICVCVYVLHNDIKTKTNTKFVVCLENFCILLILNHANESIHIYILNKKTHFPFSILTNISVVLHNLLQ